jgi:LacI family transcriptional regulator
VSRRWLEQEFRRVLGRSPHEELLEARLETARRLLVQTDLTTAEVARDSGLTSAAYLANVFRRELHCTPIEFRRRHRTGG